MIHINRFIDRIKMLESKNVKDFNMSMRDAKDLHGDITKLLLALHQLSEEAAKSNDVTEIKVDGGKW